MLKINFAFVWLGVITLVVLLFPAIGMLLTNEVQWKIGDFIVMASLVFGFGSLFIFSSRKASNIQRVIIAILLAFTFSLVWAELAVGVI
ncbi:hypothetical protein [Psychrosphaera aestuarii]|uniref:hypothetical protein n=1 Tax=Psychrosphaera aestuarii TaxID=1266052 RepID=UPI001B3382C4|nr:hypothetical protein [Psychrosphaera aestuarii]